MTEAPDDDRHQNATPAAEGRGPWWLDGDDDCPHCDQRYAWEMHVRCVSCDAPICPFCVVRVKRVTYCPDCPDSEQES